MKKKSFFPQNKLISTRVFLGCALLVLAIQLLFSQMISQEYEVQMNSQRKSAMKKIVEIAHNAIEPVIKEVRNGQISREEGIQRIRNLVRHMKYEDEFGPNYIFMSSYDGTMLVQPYEPEKEGTNQWELQDVQGKYIIRELVNAARQYPQGSFVTYSYYPPHSSIAEGKLSYVIGIPELSVYIGTGMYIESNYKALENLISLQRTGFIIITIIVFLLTAFLIRELIKGNGLLLKEIGERTFAERMLSQSEQKYKTLFEKANDAIIILDEGKFIDCNVKTEEIFGCNKKDIIGKSPFEFSPEVQPDGINSYDKASLFLEGVMNGIPQSFEWLHKDNKNKIFYAEVSLNQIDIDNKQYVQAIVRDVTERVNDREKIQWQYKALKKTQMELVEKHEELTSIYEELAASEEELRNNYEELSKVQNETRNLAERYMLVTEAAKDIIWDYDGINKKIYVSERLFEVLGYTQEEFYRDIHSFFMLIHPEDKERVNEEYLAHFKGDTPYFSSEHRLKLKNGNYKWFYARGKIAKDKDGKVIRNAGSLTDITDKILYEEEIKKLAFYDFLTDLPNRVHLIDRLKKSIVECSREDCTGAIFYIDIDNFKMINDSFGHNYGDLLLVEISKRISDELNNCLLARIGGDEFVILIEWVTSKQEIENAAKKIQKLFDTHFQVESNLFFITCSIGIAIYPRDGTTVDELLKAADMAMYEAKSLGKNKYVYYNCQMGEKLVEKIAMESRLRKAIENNELFLLYQPQIDVSTGSILGFEALLRWKNPDYGLVSPNTFIPLAEETGMILEIGNWVLKNALIFASKLNDLGYNSTWISINVSPVQLMENNFVERAKNACEQYLLDPSKIGLEVTENIFVDAFDSVISKLNELKESGFKLLLDDFGKGYSSLNYLKNLPIDTVKIDKSFVDGIVDKEKERKIVNSIITLAHNIGLTVVAEGVEKEEQLKHLLSSNCHIIQGYIFSKPITESEAIEMLNKKTGNRLDGI